MSRWTFALQNLVDTAVRFRLAWATAWHGNGNGNDLPIRSGVVVGGGGAVSVLAGTMNVRVGPTRAIVQGSAAGQGAYPWVNTADYDITLPNGGGGPTVYNIAILVQDSTFDTSGLQTSELVAYPVGSPPVGSRLDLRQVTVRAGVSLGTGGLLVSDLGNDLRKYTAANGGIVPVANSTDMTAFSTVEGTVVSRLDDLGSLRVFHSGAWQRPIDQAPSNGGWTQFTGRGVSGWSTTIWVRRWGPIVHIYGTTLRSGGSITVPVTSDIANIIIGTLPTGWTVSNMSGLTAPLASGALGRLAGIVIDPASNITLVTVAPGQDIVTGSGFSFGGMYFVA